MRATSDEFTDGANSKIWPTGFGWGEEFNGDWYTDGITVRLWNLMVKSQELTPSAGGKVEQIIIGVTNLRVQVVKGAGPLMGFDYDEEGEALGADEKNAQKRGFFRWFYD